MPTSEHWQIPWIVDLIHRESPATVLDVGAGYGKFGVLVREYSKAVRVDAVDVNPPHYPVYDNVYLGDLRNLDGVLPPDAPARYDLVLLIDVLEHLSKAEGWETLDRLARRSWRLLVATPWGYRPQFDPDMPYETHVSGWFPWEFGRRFKVHRWRVIPGHLTMHLLRPRLWQTVVLLSRKAD